MPYTVKFVSGLPVTVQSLTAELLFDANDAWHPNAAGALSIVDKIEADLTSTQKLQINAWPKPPATTTSLDIASAMSKTTVPGSGSASWTATSRPTANPTEFGQQVKLGPSMAQGVDIDWTFDSNNPPMKLKVVIRQP